MFWLVSFTCSYAAPPFETTFLQLWTRRACWAKASIGSLSRGSLVLLDPTSELLVVVDDKVWVISLSSSLSRAVMLGLGRRLSGVLVYVLNFGGRAWTTFVSRCDMFLLFGKRPSPGVERLCMSMSIFVSPRFSFCHALQSGLLGRLVWRAGTGRALVAGGALPSLGLFCVLFSSVLVRVSFSTISTLFGQPPWKIRSTPKNNTALRPRMWLEADARATLGRGFPTGCGLLVR